MWVDPRESRCVPLPGIPFLKVFFYNLSLKLDLWQHLLPWCHTHLRLFPCFSTLLYSRSFLKHHLHRLSLLANQFSLPAHYQVCSCQIDQCPMARSRRHVCFYLAATHSIADQACLLETLLWSSMLFPPTLLVICASQETLLKPPSPLSEPYTLIFLRAQY